MQSRSTLSLSTPAVDRPPALPGRQLFPSVVAPDQVVAHPAWRAALTQIETALVRPGIVAIVGPPGVGKTLMLQAAARHLRARGLVPILLQAGQLPGPGVPDAILIDDADRLRPDMLGALVRHGQRVVAAGSAMLADNLEKAGLEKAGLAKAGLAALTVQLPPLDREDARGFLATQLAHANERPDLIDTAASDRLFEASRGIPRTLQMLAGLALFVARLADAPSVTLAHVDQAILIRGGSGSSSVEDGEEESSDEVRPSGAGTATAAPRAMSPGAALAMRPRRRPYLSLVMGGLACIGAGVALGTLGDRLPTFGLFRPSIAAGEGQSEPARPPMVVAAIPDPQGPPTPPDIAPARPVAMTGPAPPAETPAPGAIDAPATVEVAPPLQAPTVFQPVSRTALPDALPAPPDPEPIAAPPPPVPTVFQATPAHTAPPPPTVQPPMVERPPVPPSTTVAARPLLMPPTAPLHVVLSYDPADRTAERAALALTAALREGGLDVARPDLGPLRDRAGVYFYYPEDAPAASVLAGQTGLGVMPQRAAYPPRPGTLRVVVTAHAAPTTPRPPVMQQPLPALHDPVAANTNKGVNPK